MNESNPKEEKYTTYLIWFPGNPGHVAVQIREEELNHSTEAKLAPENEFLNLKESDESETDNLITFTNHYYSWPNGETLSIDKQMYGDPVYIKIGETSQKNLDELKSIYSEQKTIPTKILYLNLLTCLAVSMTASILMNKNFTLTPMEDIPQEIMATLMFMILAFTLIKFSEKILLPKSKMETFQGKSYDLINLFGNNCVKASQKTLKALHPEDPKINDLMSLSILTPKALAKKAYQIFTENHQANLPIKEATHTGKIDTSDLIYQKFANPIVILAAQMETIELLGSPEDKKEIESLKLQYPAIGVAIARNKIKRLVKDLIKQGFLKEPNYNSITACMDTLPNHSIDHKKRAFNILGGLLILIASVAPPLALVFTENLDEGTFDIGNNDLTTTLCMIGILSISVLLGYALTMLIFGKTPFVMTLENADQVYAEYKTAKSAVLSSSNATDDATLSPQVT